MFRFWKRKPKQPEERSRDIFEYWDGEKNRKIDPLQAWYRLIGESDSDVIEDCDLAARGQMEARQRLSDAVRSAFEIKQYTDSQPGLTDTELSELLVSFWKYVDSLKKKHGPMPLPLRYLVSRPSSPKEPNTESSADLPSSVGESTPSAASPSSPPSMESCLAT